MRTACRSGNLDMTKYLVSKIKHPNFKEMFYKACFSDNLELVNYIFDKGDFLQNTEQGKNKIIINNNKY